MRTRFPSHRDVCFCLQSDRAHTYTCGIYANRDAPGIATASLKGQWVFEDGKRGAVLVMHNPRQVYLPPNIVLEALYHVDKLIDKWLVTSVQVCPAYSMYLSDGCTCHAIPGVHSCAYTDRA